VAGMLSDSSLFHRQRAPVVALFLALSVPALFAYRTYGTSELSNSLLMVLVGLLLGGPATVITTACAVDIADGASAASVATIAGVIDGVGSVGAGCAQSLVAFVQREVAAKHGDAASWNAVFYMLAGCTGLAAVIMSIRTIRKRFCCPETSRSSA
jgi:sugar phosphate permease